MSHYIPSTADEQQAMLVAIGLVEMSDLYQDIPQGARLNRPLNIEGGMGEMQVRREMAAIARKNRAYHTVLRGAGAYRHYIPAAVKAAVGKEEFLTAYTPYQAEISQGILQSIFEYQTMICELTGMDVSNASVYDGASAAAEAVAMCRERSRTTALVAGSVHPDTLATIKTYAFGADTGVKVVPLKDGGVDAQELEELLPGAACLVVQQPNFFGCIEDAKALFEKAHAAGVKCIMSVNPIAMGILQSPGEAGADIAVDEGQPLGLPLSYGGPYLGLMACKQAMMRKLPGRIVGQTTDVEGKRAFVLTLQAREQHIRREKASSNVCSNEAHCALTAGAYLAAVGSSGLKEVATQCISKAHYFAAHLERLGFARKYSGEFFHEFVTTCPTDARMLENAMGGAGILSGLPLENNDMLWCVTEMASKDELDVALRVIGEVLGV